MSWIYDTAAGVEEYVAATEGQDGADLVERLARHLPPGARVLEIGSGPGRDLELLARHWRVVGSDRSRAFVDRLRRRIETARGASRGDSPGVERVEVLDAVDLCVEPAGPPLGCFDAVFSNKVLHHLDDEQLLSSLRAQTSVCGRDGLLLHSFWKEGAVGTPGGREHDGLLFLPRSPDRARQMLEASGFEVVEYFEYGELGAVDSFAIVAQLRGGQVS